MTIRTFILKFDGDNYVETKEGSMVVHNAKGTVRFKEGVTPASDTDEVQESDTEEKTKFQSRSAELKHLYSQSQYSDSNLKRMKELTTEYKKTTLTKGLDFFKKIFGVNEYLERKLEMEILFITQQKLDTNSEQRQITDLISKYGGNQDFINEVYKKTLEGRKPIKKRGGSLTKKCRNHSMQFSKKRR